MSDIDIVDELRNPEEFYPDNFQTAMLANAFYSGLCQDAADEIKSLRQRVKKLQALNDDAESVIIRQRDKRKNLEEANNTLRQQLADEIQRWKNACELLNKAEDELAKLKGITAFNPNNAASNVQLGILKQSQDEPVAWLRKEMRIVDGLWEDDLSLNFNGDGIPLYTSAPTIPEGWQVVPINPTNEMILAAVKGQSNRTTVPRDDELAAGMYYDMLAAAPKPEDVK